MEVNEKSQYKSEMVEEFDKIQTPKSPKLPIEILDVDHMNEKFENNDNGFELKEKTTYENEMKEEFDNLEMTNEPIEAYGAEIANEKSANNEEEEIDENELKEEPNKMELLNESMDETYDLESSNENIEKPFKCEFCNKAFKSKYYVKTHEMKCEGKDYNEMANEIKGVEINRYGTFDESLQVYKCKKCDKNFKSKYQVKYHYTYVHEKPHKCEKCNKTFGKKDELDYHFVKVHEGINDLDCEDFDEIKKVHHKKKSKLNKTSHLYKKEIVEDDATNPWLADNFEEFLFYCCPGKSTFLHKFSNYSRPNMIFHVINDT